MRGCSYKNCGLVEDANYCELRDENRNLTDEEAQLEFHQILEHCLLLDSIPKFPLRDKKTKDGNDNSSDRDNSEKFDN